MAPSEPQQWQRQRQLWRQEGERRLGTAGGTARLAEAIMGALGPNQQNPGKQTPSKQHPGKQTPSKQPSKKQWP